MMLLASAGIRVEKCSCTGRLSLTMVGHGCCPDEEDCGVSLSMHLSDYMPVEAGHVDMPAQPLLFSIFPLSVPCLRFATAWTPAVGNNPPPVPAATTVAILRV